MYRSATLATILRKPRLVLASLIACSCFTFCYAEEVKPLSENTAQHFIDDELYILTLPAPYPTLVDNDSSYQANQLIDSLQFELSEYRPSLEPSKKDAWYRFTLDTSTLTKQKTVGFMFGTQLIPKLDFYLYNKGELVATRTLGYQFQHHQETPFSTDLTYDLKPNEIYILLIKVKTDSTGLVPIILTSEAGAQEINNDLHLFWGLLISFFLALVLYNSLIYLTHHGAHYLWYVVFLSFSFIVIGVLDGFGYLIWQEQVQEFFIRNILAFIFLINWALLNFNNVFLSGTSPSQKTQKRYRYFTQVFLVLAIITLILPEYVVFPVFSIMQFVVIAVSFYIGFKLIKKGSIFAYSFILGWVFAFVGGITGTATFIGLIEANPVTTRGFMIGVILQLLMFAIALALRLNETEKKTTESIYLDHISGLPNRSYLFNILPNQLRLALLRNPNLALVRINFHIDRLSLTDSGFASIQSIYQVLRNRIKAASDINNKLHYFSLPQGQKYMAITSSSNEATFVINHKNNNLELLVKKIESVLREPVNLGSITTDVNFTVSVIPQIDINQGMEEIYRKLEICTLEANLKNQRIVFYSTLFEDRLKEEMVIINELRSAISHGTLDIEIQPQVQLNTESIIAGEILIRWNHSTLGFVSPGVFIPLAEQSGLIFDITKLVMKKTFELLHSTNQAALTLSMNLSAHDIGNKELIPYMEQLEAEFGAQEQSLCFEITESENIHKHEWTQENLLSLRQKGYGISIDDFGTGFSSLSYLNQIQPREIKIDRSFITFLEESSENQTIIRAIINIAQAFGARTVAEGIETESQKRLLANMGVNLGQGFYWYRSLSVNEFLNLYLKR